MAAKKFVLEFSKISARDAERLGGKKAAVGKMLETKKLVAKVETGKNYE